MTDKSTAASQRLAARIAGLAFVFGILYVPVYLLTSASLIVAGDAASTVTNIQASPMLFRVGIASSLVMYVSVFVLITALYVTVAPVNRNIALLGLVLRLPEATLGLVSLIFSVLIAQIVSGDAPVAGLTSQQVQASVQFALQGGDATAAIGLVFMALGSLPFLYLFFTARYAPRLLLGFGMLAYAFALLSAFSSILAPGSAVAGMQMMLVLPVMVFELVFGLWLAIKGIDLPETERPSARQTLPKTHGVHPAARPTSVQP